MKILIAEDEMLVSEMLREMLIELGHEVIGQAKNYEEAISILEDIEYVDFAICDINFNRTKNGIDLGEVLTSQYELPFIYLSSYSDDETLLEASRTLPGGYLVKPFSSTDLKAVLIMMGARLKDQEKFIVFKDGIDIVKLSSAEVLYLQSDGNYITINTQVKRYVIRNSLDYILNDFMCKDLVRVHRSFVVNVKMIDIISSHHLRIGNDEIPISRKYKDTIMSLYK